MKKKYIIATVTSIFVMFVLLSANVYQSRTDIFNLRKIEIMSRANATVNPMCPTGCVERDGFCYCNGMSSYHWNPPKGSTL